MRSAECGIAREGCSRDDPHTEIPHSEFHTPHYVFAMRHLYLHVPFCTRRCSYCDFSIAVRKRIAAREYVDAVVQELRQVLTDPGRKPGDLGAGATDLVGVTHPGRKPGDSGSEVLETIYLGGGTPSLLPPDALATLLTSLRDAFH